MKTWKTLKLQNISNLLNSPFVTAKRKFHNGYDKGQYSTNNFDGGCGSMSSNSTPYSQVSVPSSYDDYEDDFTSDEESEASVVHGSVNNAK